MRLLNTTSFTFREFWTADAPPYAILSHCWSQDPNDPEITHPQLLARRYDINSLAWEKIAKCCRIAASRGFEWAWIDTCCINKESSAELTEAINSMFLWYRDAKECYAFLDDVVGQQAHPDGAAGSGVVPDGFCRSRWFSRGWTLQELLAPPSLLFFDQDGVSIGSRSDLCEPISLATQISPDFLNGKRGINEASIARRMSWASQRCTSRVEDRAYSLLGIFDVNLPLLYGEGSKAFQRLQLAIIQQSNDQSIYAWGIDRPDTSPFGILAESPADFEGSENVSNHGRTGLLGAKPNQVTSIGIDYTYPVSAGDWVLPYLRSVFPFRLSTRELGATFIHLPCKIERPTGNRAELFLIVEQTSAFHPKRAQRLGVRRVEPTLLVLFLSAYVVHDSNVYIACNHVPERRGGLIRLIKGTKAGWGRLRPYTVIRTLAIISCIVGCAMGIQLGPGRWNPMLTFGILICARDIGKTVPYSVWIEDWAILWIGVLLYVASVRNK